MYYISRNYKSLFNASGKAKTDVEISLKNCGFKNLGFKQSSIPNSAFGAIKNFFGITLALIRLPYKSVLCTQYPNKKFRNYILFVANLKKCKIITVIHDVRSLRGRTKHLKEELAKINNCDVIIVHNDSMKAWFLEQNTKIPIVVLELFDYVLNKKPTQNSNHKEKDSYEIAYAGGFGGIKNSFVYDFDLLKHKSYSVKLYGPNFEPEKRKVKTEDSIVDYVGVFPSDLVPFEVKGDFGLVWDGVSAETCDGQYGHYLKFNNPHKTSLYLLCGLPVIIWDQAAIASFIEENKIGITISNLNDLSDKLNDLDKEDYKLMKENVHKVQEKIMKGMFVQTAIEKALKQL